MLTALYRQDMSRRQPSPPSVSPFHYQSTADPTHARYQGRTSGESSSGALSPPPPTHTSMPRPTRSLASRADRAAQDTTPASWPNHPTPWEWTPRGCEPRFTGRTCARGACPHTRVAPSSTHSLGEKSTTSPDPPSINPLPEPAGHRPPPADSLAAPTARLSAQCGCA